MMTGFVGREPEERFTNNGKKVNSFPLAINFMKNGEKVTIWYKVLCWNNMGENILPHLKKGSCITVFGDLNPPSTYQNKKGDIAIDMSVNAQSISFLPTLKTEKEEKKDPSVFEQESFA
jgi:single-stranded DNA-binding protein